MPDMDESLWIPGPTYIRPELLEELVRPSIGHRSKQMTELVERCDPGLRLAFGLTPDSSAHVAVHSTSATGLMEAALQGAGPRVLCLVNGAFSKRFAQIATILGKEVVPLEVPFGEVAPIDDVRRALETQGPFDAVTVVVNETSTGTSTPLGALAELLGQHPQVRLLADVVSWIAGAPIDFDEHGIDFAFAGIQKAFALPPGIAVLCASERYLQEARERGCTSWYHDPVRIVDGHEKRKTPATPAIPQYRALVRQLDDISSGQVVDHAPPGAPAWQARFERHRRMQQRTLEWARGRGLTTLPSKSHASPTVSCLRAGDIDVAGLVQGLAARGLQISNGYGDLKGQTFRIGHMGDHTDAGLDALLTAADEVLAGP